MLFEMLPRKKGKEQAGQERDTKIRLVVDIRCMEVLGSCLCNLHHKDRCVCRVMGSMGKRK